MNVTVSSYSSRQTQGIKQRVSHTKPTYFTRQANAFDTWNKLVSHEKQTRFCLHVNVFHTLSKRVFVFVRTRFTRKANAFTNL